MTSELSSCHTDGSLVKEDALYDDIDIVSVNLDVPVPVTVSESSNKLLLLGVWKALKRYMNTKLCTL